MDTEHLSEVETISSDTDEDTDSSSDGGEWTPALVYVLSWGEDDVLAFPGDVARNLAYTQLRFMGMDLATAERQVRQHGEEPTTMQRFLNLVLSHMP